MPTYEMPLIIRQVARPEMIATLKRTANCIFDNGGFIRKIENLGHRPLPFKMSAHSQVHKVGSYFLFTFDAPSAALRDLIEEYNRDVDLVKRTIFKLEEKESVECTLQEELLPPAYRKEVIEMIETARNSHKYKKEQKRTVWKSNSGLDYYPFQR